MNNKQRDIIAYLYCDGKTYTDIKKELGVTVQEIQAQIALLHQKAINPAKVKDTAKVTLQYTNAQGEVKEYQTYKLIDYRVVIAYYKRGESITQIAKELGTSTAFIKRMLNRKWFLISESLDNRGL